MGNHVRMKAANSLAGRTKKLLGRVVTTLLLYGASGSTYARTAPE